MRSERSERSEFERETGNIVGEKRNKQIGGVGVCKREREKR